MMRPKGLVMFVALTGVCALSACEPIDEADQPIEQQEGEARSSLPQFSVLMNPTGASATFSTKGTVDLTTRNAFFRPIGTNGRTCGSCHVPQSGWGITPVEVRRRFESTGGQDPIFRTNDGANSPLANVSTVTARRAAYTMLLTKGLIRVGIALPANAEFELQAVDDPYHFASAAELSLFRRPLPSTNLKFLAAVMWDGRESTPLVNGGQTPAALLSDLSTQSNDATRGHAAGMSDLTAADRAAIVDFEMSLFTAQYADDSSGFLDQGRHGWARPLAALNTYFGINDVLGGDPTGAAFNPRVFTSYDAWATARGSQSAARKAVARGQALFNTARLSDQGVRGVNDALNVESLTGTSPPVTTRPARAITRRDCRWTWG